MAEKDFIGFTFDGIHSDTMGILRVSDGDRYKEDLQPEIKDLTAEVPGMHGEYYFGSTYGNKEFEIDIAYDSLTEIQFRNLRRLFSGKEIHELIFDERPYKKYLVKLANPIELSYTCFDEPEKEEIPFDGIYGPTTILRPTGKMQRTYKGDGSINFVAYYPFAKNVFKTLPYDYFKTKDTRVSLNKTYYVYIENIGYQEVSNPIEENLNIYYEQTSLEWAESSGLLTVSEYNDIKDLKPATAGKPAYFKIYNPGDIPTGIRIYCLFGSSNVISNLEFIYKYNPASETENNEIVLTNVVKKGNDVGILIDTDTQLIVGLASEPVIHGDFQVSYITSNNIYNESITRGKFFKLGTNITKEESKLYINGIADIDVGIFYDYLYF